MAEQEEPDELSQDIDRLIAKYSDRQAMAPSIPESRLQDVVDVLELVSTIDDITIATARRQLIHLRDRLQNAVASSDRCFAASIEREFTRIVYSHPKAWEAYLVTTSRCVVERCRVMLERFESLSRDRPLTEPELLQRRQLETALKDAETHASRWRS